MGEISPQGGVRRDYKLRRRWSRFGNKAASFTSRNLVDEEEKREIDIID